MESIAARLLYLDDLKSFLTVTVRIRSVDSAMVSATRTQVGTVGAAISHLVGIRGTRWWVEHSCRGVHPIASCDAVTQGPTTE